MKMKINFRNVIPGLLLYMKSSGAKRVISIFVKLSQLTFSYLL